MNKTKVPDISGWNYRIFKYKDNRGYGVHEAHYDKKNNVIGWTTEAIIVGDTVQELFEVLEMIKKDMERLPDVLDYD